MSRAAKSIVVFLLLLLFGAVGLSMFLHVEKKQVIQAKESLEKQVDDFQEREKKNIVSIRDLKANIEALEATKTELEEKLASADSGVKELTTKIEAITEEKSKLTERMTTLQKERDDLLVKIEEKAEQQIVYKYIDREDGKTSEAASDAVSEAEGDSEETAEAEVPGTDDEAFWAKVIKEKTTLELDVDGLKTRLTESQVMIEELKKENSDIEMELGMLKNQKEDITRKVKTGEDLADSLSLALARAENDKKFLNDRLVKINDENIGLRGQIKNLSSTKVALEKSIVRIQEEKKEVENKLFETENVIQNRIDEIWKIKESLQTSIQSTKASGASDVELSPIVVTQDSLAENAQDEGYSTPGFDGNVVSINAENNFVIIDIGQDDGLKLGDNMSVYRGAEYVAAVEVIQVRKDIAAADIRNKVDKILVGDSVR